MMIVSITLALKIALKASHFFWRDEKGNLFWRDEKGRRSYKQNSYLYSWKLQTTPTCCFHDKHVYVRRNPFQSNPLFKTPLARLTVIQLCASFIFLKCEWACSIMYIVKRALQVLFVRYFEIGILQNPECTLLYSRWTFVRTLSLNTYMGLCFT